MKLSNQTILITGAAGRIGAATAEEALREGAKVILGDISINKLNSLVQKLSDTFPSEMIYSINTDITSLEGISLLIEKAISFSNHLNGAVHCAYPTSSGWGSGIENLEFKNLSQDLTNQLGGAILFSKEVMKVFDSQGFGNLIHISSIQGIRPPKFDHYQGTSMVSPIEYAAIKAGIIAISSWLAKYYRNKNIRVNCISPGGILDSQPESFIKRYRNSCTNIGLLNSDQISSSIIFLLSEESIAINGQNIIIDDGWTL
tara:strand:- start:336 stop:1109 length:774 start_codon:yes stop_codon:yes gene_type:complete